MNSQESIKVLGLIKVAYPSAMKDLTEKDALAMAKMWEMQFSDYPYFLIALAVQKHIATNKFPPSPSEVNEQIKHIEYETGSLLSLHNQAERMLQDEEWKSCHELFEKDLLQDDMLKRVKMINQASRIRRKQNEIPLLNLIKQSDFVQVGSAEMRQLQQGE